MISFPSPFASEVGGLISIPEASAARQTTGLICFVILFIYFVCGGSGERESEREKGRKIFGIFYLSWKKRRGR
jgi:hypothetical protein